MLNDSEAHQEDISKYRNQQMAWPEIDPNEKQKSNENPNDRIGLQSP